MRLLLVLFIVLLPTYVLASCDNPTDRRIFDQHRGASFTKALNDCGHSCFGDGSCSAHCLQKKLGLTTSCAQCFGENVHCVAKHCFFECLDPNSSACRNCARDHCVPALEHCSGCRYEPGQEDDDDQLVMEDQTCRLPFVEQSYQWLKDFDDDD